MGNVINIGVFGNRNVGKSSLINALLKQDMAIVSDVAGTTTDPVRCRFEFPGLGPAVLIDTAGIDDYGELGKKRVAKSVDAVTKIDVAIVVLDRMDTQQSDAEKNLREMLEKYAVPVVIVRNKVDSNPPTESELGDIERTWGSSPVMFSAVASSEEMIEQVLDAVRKAAGSSRFTEHEMFYGLISKEQRILLVCPIDSEAPAGRLILPQVMAIRNILDYGASATVTKPENVAEFFTDGKSEFDLVVTDSQAFSEVAAVVPENVPLTSFSMLLARSKGCFAEYMQGVGKVGAMQDGDRVLILESCTHHASCEDIGRVKIPALLRKFSGKKLEFDVVGGLAAIERPIEDYALVIQCGGCMVTKRQLYSRLLPAIEKDIPVVNYGMAISYMKGIYDRAIKPLV